MITQTSRTISKFHIFVIFAAVGVIPVKRDWDSAWTHRLQEDSAAAAVESSVQRRSAAGRLSDDGPSHRVRRQASPDDDTEEEESDNEQIIYVTLGIGLELLWFVLRKFTRRCVTCRPVFRGDGTLARAKGRAPQRGSALRR